MCGGVQKKMIANITNAGQPMVPVTAFYAARDALQRQGFEVASHVSPGLGHSIDMPGLMLGQQFLSEVLA